jgi:MFS family permease
LNSARGEENLFALQAGAEGCRPHKNLELGFVFGPALGGALSQISLQAPAYAAGTLSLISAIVGCFVLPESLPQEQRTAGVFQWREVNPLATLLDMIRRPALGMLLLVWCLFQFAFTGHTSILAVFVIDRFGMSPVQLAFLFVVGGIANAIVQGGLVGRLAPRFGEKRLALASLGLQALTAIALVAAPVFWLLYPIMVLNSAATALIWPTMGALMANQVPLPEQGQISGASTALGSLMSVFGPLWAGAIYDQFAPVAPYWSSMLVFALAAPASAGARVGNRGMAPAVQSSGH